MLPALSEAGIRPNLIVGTSIGAVNGVPVAADPSPARRSGSAGCAKGEEPQLTFSEKIWSRAIWLERSGMQLHTLESLRRVLLDAIPGYLRRTGSAVSVCGVQGRGCKCACSAVRPTDCERVRRSAAHRDLPKPPRDRSAVP